MGHRARAKLILWSRRPTVKLHRHLAILSLSFLIAAPAFARQTTTTTPTAQQSRKETKVELKQQHKADMAQAKADKAEAKAVNTKEAKRAAKAQDKANAQQPQ